MGEKYYGIQWLPSAVEQVEGVYMMTEFTFWLYLLTNDQYVQCVNVQGHLYLLVTDQGFLQEESVVWESLHNVEGDGNFCDSDFRLCHPSQKPSATSQPSAQQQQQMQINQVIKVLPAFSYHIVVISLTCSTFSWSNQIPKQNKSPFLPNDYAVSLRNMSFEKAALRSIQWMFGCVIQDYLVAMSLQQQQGEAPGPLSDLELARQLQQEEYQQPQTQQDQPSAGQVLPFLLPKKSFIEMHKIKIKYSFKKPKAVVNFSTLS